MAEKLSEYDRHLLLVKYQKYQEHRELMQKKSILKITDEERAKIFKEVGISLGKEIRVPQKDNPQKSTFGID